MNIGGIIDARAGKILLESEIIKKPEYKWLKNLLEENDTHQVKNDRLDNLEDKHRTFLTSDLYKNFYKTASNEWEIDHLDESEEKLECSLCGEKNTKKKYYIKNKINKKTLNVGSTCINNFRDIRDSKGKTVSEIDKEWRRQQRKKALNDMYPGIIEKIDNWNKKIEDIPTIVNGNMEQEYEKIYNQIQNSYKEFMKNKNKNTDMTIAQKINDLVSKGEDILQRIYNDVDKKRDNEWYITKEIKEWCFSDREKNETVINFLKQDGLVNTRNSPRIYERNLVNKILEKLKISFNNSNVIIRNFNESTKTITVNISNNPYVSRINLECSYNEFMLEFGYVVFEENKKYSGEKEFVIKKSKIIDDSSINSSISTMKFLLNKSNIRIYDWNTQYNEIVFYGNNDNYIIVKAKQFVNNFIEYIFSNKLLDKDIQKIYDYVLKNSESISIKEYKDRIETREKTDKGLHTDYSRFV